VNLAGVEVSCATVIGFARTGKALTEFLLSRGIEVFVTEAGVLSGPDRATLAGMGVGFEDGGHTDRALGADLIVPSPVVPIDSPVLQQARDLGIPILSEIDLAAWVCRETPILAVTGTNGKSTTVLFLAALLRRAGLDPVVAGNIGVPFIALVDRAADRDAAVVEVSSFQLEQSQRFHPRVAVLLNLTPDHLERHGTLAGYAAAKARLFAHQSPDDTAVLRSDLLASFPGIAARIVLFDREELPATPVIDGLPPHHRMNLAAAICACRVLVPSFDPARIADADLEGALALPYRLQSEGEVHGIRILNDSKSTNAASSVVALESVPGEVLLLLGGRHKHAGYEVLARLVGEREVKRTYLYGEAVRFLADALAAVGYHRIERHPDLRSAFAAALRAGASGDTLLFSPGCASYDQFDSFMQRGEVFSQLVAAARRA